MTVYFSHLDRGEEEKHGSLSSHLWEWSSASCAELCSMWSTHSFSPWLTMWNFTTNSFPCSLMMNVTFPLVVLGSEVISTPPLSLMISALKEKRMWQWGRFATEMTFTLYIFHTCIMYLKGDFVVPSWTQTGRIIYLMITVSLWVCSGFLKRASSSGSGLV